MRILHISKAKSWRGGERQVSNLLESLSDKEDCVNYFLCRKDSELNERIDTLLKFSHKGSFFSWIFKVREICKENNIDLIHAHESKGHTISILACAFFLKIPVIVTRRVVFPVKGMLSKLKYKKTKKVICISNAVKQEMLKVVEEKSTEIISSAISINKFDNLDNATFEFLNNTKIKVGYVAALSPEKDHYTFLMTAKKVLQKNTNIIFYIIGDGKLSNEIQRTINELDLNESVKMVGFIKNINELIIQLDYLLFTSKFEGLGSTVLDFFLAKKPVVATNSLGVKDLIKDGHTGFLCDKGNYQDLARKLLLLVNNDELKEQIVSNAYEFVKSKFSLKTLGEEHYNFYKSII